MELVTTHAHTSFCGHGEGTVEELAAAAEAAGVTTLAVTEHYPLSKAFDPRDYLSMPAARVGEYLAAIDEAVSYTHLVDHVGQRDGECDQREGQKAGHDVAGVDAHGTGSPRGRGRNGRAGRACAAHVTIIGDGARAAARAIASTLRLRRL